MLIDYVVVQYVVEITIDADHVLRGFVGCRFGIKKYQNNLKKQASPARLRADVDLAMMRTFNLRLNIQFKKLRLPFISILCFLTSKFCLASHFYHIIFALLSTAQSKCYTVHRKINFVALKKARKHAR